MASVQILYWQDIPSQVKATDGFDEVNLSLHDTFMERIDAAAEAKGLSGADDYLKQWRWGDAEERDGSPQEVAEAGRSLDEIIIDPGLAPVGADTYGLVNTGLDTMRMINGDPDLQGIHMLVGLSNFAWGTPKEIRHELEKAYLTLGMEFGLDFALANPERSPRPLAQDDPMVDQLRQALAQGRRSNGESQEMAGFRQAEAIMDICNVVLDLDW